MWTPTAMNDRLLSIERCLPQKVRLNVAFFMGERTARTSSILFGRGVHRSTLSTLTPAANILVKVHPLPFRFLTETTTPRPAAAAAAMSHESHDKTSRSLKQPEICKTKSCVDRKYSTQEKRHGTLSRSHAAKLTPNTRLDTCTKYSQLPLFWLLPSTMK